MPPDVRCLARQAVFWMASLDDCGQRVKNFGGAGLDPLPLLFLSRERPNTAVRYAKKSSTEEKRAISALQNEGNPSFGGSLPDLFLEAQNRYHSIREVATHKEPGKDKGRAQHRGTMAMRETAAGRRPVQRSR